MPRYFPLLRWKQGEQGALQNLGATIKSQIAPIIDFPDNCSCTDNRIVNFPRDLAACWMPEQDFYIDLNDVEVETYNGAHPFLDLLSTLHAQSFSPIPIIRTDSDADTITAIATALRENLIHHIAIRIFQDETDQADSELEEILNVLDIAPENCDLILDFENLSNGRITANLRLLQSILTQFDNNYRKKILLSGAFNPSLVDTDSYAQIPRHDFSFWQQANQQIESELQFGDYTTVQVELVESRFQGAPKIKYTQNQHWYVIKGHRSRGRDAQRQQLSQHIINQPFYRSQTFSFGDLRIFQCAHSNWGPGSAANWVTNDVNQHITFVVNQLTSIAGAPSNIP